MSGAAPFDRRALDLHRRRALRLAGGDLLFREVGARLAERLDDLARRFPLALELGARRGTLRPLLEGRAGIRTLIQAEASPAYARLLAPPRLVADEERLPLAPASLDLVASNLALHWVNDLPGALLAVRRALRPDGLFLASLLGGETLAELRAVLAEAELAATGGLAPRLSPMVDIRAAGGLLQRAGFALPVVDVDRLELRYPDALALMRELRAMGETNALALRSRGFARRDVLLGAAALYGRRHGDGQGRVAARFEVVYLAGWAPHRSQQRPLAPGSARASLAEALGGDA